MGSTKRSREVVSKNSSKLKRANKSSSNNSPLPPPPPPPPLLSQSKSKQQATQENRDDDEVLDFLIPLQTQRSKQEEWSFDLEEDDDQYTDTEEGLSSSLEDGLFGLALVDNSY